MKSRSGCRGLERLRAREPVFGALQTVPAPTVTELAILSGYDFVILDCEHGIADEASQLASLQILGMSDAFAVVRVRPRDLTAVGRYLDFGADAILMPDVRTADEASAFVAASRIGPRGTRSSAGHGVRGAKFGLAGSDEPLPLLFAMVESAQAVKNVSPIAATPGLCGLVVGPLDLAADLGAATDFTAASYLQAIEAVERAAADGGLILGTAPNAAFPIPRLIERGYRFILTSIDVLALRDGLRSHLAAARADQTAGAAARATIS